MYHTIQQIIDNQKLFKEEIMLWLSSDLKQTKKELENITNTDNFIQEAKKKLVKKIKRVKLDKHVSKLFYEGSSRNKEFYVWWDTDNKEAIILKYD